MADFLYKGHVTVLDSMVKNHLKQLSSCGVISSFDGQYRLQFHDLRLDAYCQHLNAEVGDEDAFRADQICCPSGHYLVIFSNDDASRASAKNAMHDAIGKEDGRRTWR
ncbi:hypothetical protein [Stutzerimonas nitrititolerans]|uniref:hypothetical protein n=1 Tax=Stutzerimonas nitrititolerans TaxID=2482751 RepID=UPI0028A05A77|nr:hypothetical protein [Stutzerimonas nitrititolerans]